MNNNYLQLIKQFKYSLHEVNEHLELLKTDLQINNVLNEKRSKCINDISSIINLIVSSIESLQECKLYIENEINAFYLDEIVNSVLHKLKYEIYYKTNVISKIEKKIIVNTDYSILFKALSESLKQALSSEKEIEIITINALKDNDNKTIIEVKDAQIKEYDLKNNLNNMTELKLINDIKWKIKIELNFTKRLAIYLIEKDHS